MKCPRTGCDSEAIMSRTLGVLPCRECQIKDGNTQFLRPDILHLGKSHRIQAQRDKHAKDLLQPFAGNGVNPDFFKAYPEQIKTYGVQKDLEKS
jgi:hypothetical protein